MRKQAAIFAVTFFVYGLLFFPTLGFSGDRGMIALSCATVFIVVYFSEFSKLRERLLTFFVMTLTAGIIGYLLSYCIWGV
ncbi:MAG: hypothetical protein QG620_496 [Patescibacteria group bacterium]|nr:hypothetical protein [Patescibacteria group bacterium]